MKAGAGGTRSLHLSWAVLILASLSGLGTAAISGHPRLAAAALMLVAGVKGALILRNFMELKDGPAAFRVFFSLWLLACVVAITALFALAPGR